MTIIKESTTQEDLKLINGENRETQETEENSTVQEKIETLERELETQEANIKKLWDQVLASYILDNANQSRILSDLDEYDYSKFHKIVINNSPSYNFILEELSELYKKL